MSLRTNGLRGRHAFPIVMVAAIGITASIVAWYFTVRAEERAFIQEFDGRAANQALVLQSGIGDYMEKLYAVRALFDASSSPVTRDQFEIFGHAILKGYPAILNISWVPHVMRDQRIVHEQAAVHDGLSNYRILEVTPEGALRPAPEVDEYFPKFYSTEDRSSPVYGLDLGEESGQIRTIERARDGDTPASSSPIVLQIGAGDRHGFWIVLPVYARGLPHDTVENRRRNLIGLVQGVFQIGVMFDGILAGVTTPVQLYLFAPNAGEKDLSLYSTSRVSHQSVPAESQQALAEEPHRSFPIDIADARWTLMEVPQSNALISVDHSRSWLMLIPAFC